MPLRSYSALVWFSLDVPSPTSDTITTGLCHGLRSVEASGACGPFLRSVRSIGFPPEPLS
jgi:hypothetical protein